MTKQIIEILHKVELPSRGSWHTIVQPLQLDEQGEMKTFTTKVTFSIDEDCCDMACPELSKSNILCKDDHDMDGSDKENDFDTTQQSES